jgi:pyruvate kinase
MTLPKNKTKIVATIGPACDSPEMLERLIRAGLNIARLNFSHGDFSGHAERIARCNPPLWIVALSPDPAVCQGLRFSYGVEPIQLVEDPQNWRQFAQAWITEHQLPGTMAMVVAGPSPRNPEANYRIEFLRVGDLPASTSLR